MVGTIAQLIIGAVIGSAVLGTDESWVKFLSGIGAIVLTFLAGAELDPDVFKKKWKEATAIGLAGFFFPFFGCTAGAYYVLGWGVMQSWLGGVALSIHIGRRRLCRDDRVRPEQDRVRQDRLGGLTLLMSTGLTFGTISSLYGLSHGIIDQSQYSILVASVIGSAVIPTLIANAFFLPRHLLPRPDEEKKTSPEHGRVGPLQGIARQAE